MASPDSLIETLLEQMLIRTGHRPSPAEQKSWGRSLPVLARDLVDAGLPGVEMLIEYHLPLTSQRADVVLAGAHPHTGQASYVVVELKQWSAARSYEGSAELVDVPGMPGGPKLHPVAQVQGYCSYLADFTRALYDQPDALAGVAYLHNATDPAAVADLRRYPVSTTGRLFTGADRGDLLDFLRTRLAPDSGGHAAGDTLLRSAVAPSKQLLKVAADEVRDRKVAGARAPRVQKMFKYFNQFMAAERNGLDVLILDEAHRIRATSVDRYTKAALRTDRPQLDELIAAARVPVFLLDEHQVVRPGEMGSLAQILRHTESLGLDAQHVHLGEQFRCGGSQEYLLWTQKLLGLVEGAAERWRGDPQFAVRVAESPEEMEHLLRMQLEQGYSARISAGYCWPWSDPRPDGSMVNDVQVGAWARAWNLKGDRAIGDAPPSALWATNDGGFDQVGCVYTAQGFEYDWSGVILGPDLVWRGGRFTTVRAANRDPDMRNQDKVPEPQFDRLVRHVYKVLLTRGMVGTVLYSTDPQTQEVLRELIPD